MRDRIWFTWETQRRNRSLAEAFRCTYAPFDHCHRHALIRYPLSAFQTVWESVRHSGPTMYDFRAALRVICHQPAKEGYRLIQLEGRRQATFADLHSLAMKVSG